MLKKIDKAFSLAEMMVVMLIVSIAAAATVPVITKRSKGSSIEVAEVPSGAIIIWKGSVETIPVGWVLCNGANGTPDLRSRFVIGAGGSYAVTNFGGATAQSITLTIGNLPSHTHTITSTSTDHTHSGTTSWMDQNWSHAHSGWTGWMNQNNVHSHSGWTGGMSANAWHTHKVMTSWKEYDNGRRSGGWIIGSSGSSAHWSASISDAYVDHTHAVATADVDINHTHAVGMNATDTNHKHDFSTGWMNQNNSHTHTASSTGSGAAVHVDIIPPYYALCYIMKL